MVIKFFETDAYEPPFNIYNILENKTSALQEEGMDDDDIKDFITTDINIHLKQFYATSLHFSALFNRIKKKTVSISSHIDLPVPINTKEYEVAIEIHTLIEKRYNLTIPPIEIEYLALLLTSIQESSRQERVGIVVAAHGSSTATSMVAVARKLYYMVDILN